MGAVMSLVPSPNMSLCYYGSGGAGRPVIDNRRAHLRGHAGPMAVSLTSGAAAVPALIQAYVQREQARREVAYCSASRLRVGSGLLAR